MEVLRGKDPGEDVFPAVDSVRHLLAAEIRPKVLRVGDQPSNLLAPTSVLDVPDQELVTAASGHEALKKLLQHEDFAVIILDVQMPGMDGYETAGHIKRRAKSRNIPIIFLTAIGNDPDYSMRGYGEAGATAERPATGAAGRVWVRPEHAGGKPADSTRFIGPVNALGGDAPVRPLRLTAGVATRASAGRLVRLPAVRPGRVREPCQRMTSKTFFCRPLG